MPDAATIPNDLLLAEELRKAMGTGGPQKNWLVDIAGNLGMSKMAPTLTNVPNTLSVSAHGGKRSGFSPDTTATNSLARIVYNRVKDGSELSMEDIASAMGSATNDVKRVIIDACYAAGYNYEHVKKLFPNLEEIIAPSTSASTSAQYLRDLTRPTPEEPGGGHSLTNLSPMFRVTPQSTNVVSQVSDWLPSAQQKKVMVPITGEESFMQHVNQVRPRPNVWSPTNYSSRAYLPASEINKQLEAIKQWQMDQYKGKHLSNEEFDAVLREVNRRIDEVFK